MLVARLIAATIVGLTCWISTLVTPTLGAQMGQSSQELTATEKQLIESTNSFGFKLFQSIIKQQDSDSIAVVSPLSVAVALAMTCNGARGETEEAMKQTLELLDIPMEQVNESYRSLLSDLKTSDAEVLLKTAQSIWCRSGFDVEEDFMDVNRTHFDAEVAVLNFSDPLSVNRINGWVNDKTDGKIDRILQSIPRDAVMYLLNAVYFKGIWATQFDPEKTRDEPFRLMNGSHVMCRMMKMKESSHGYYADREKGFAAVDLPYGDGRFSMTVVLPDEDRHIDVLVSALNSDDWNKMTNRFHPSNVILEIPKFKLEYGLELKDALEALGMGIAFMPLAADFRGINREEGDSLYISRVVHKTFVEVNEEGTEAAAATLVEMAKVASVGPSSKLLFRVDRPFLFAIRDRHTGTVIFLGKITDPSA